MIDRIIYNTQFLFSFFSLKDVISPMATYQNVGLINSPNINNNNNNHHQHLSPTSNRDSYDYSSKKPHQHSNSKSSIMPKHHYQNTTTNKRDFLPSGNGTDYLTPVDMDTTTTNSNEPTKRVTNTNGKFSIQKMIRQGFSSWRTRRKPPSSSTPPPPSSVSINTSTPPPPSSSSERSITTDNDLSQIHPSTNIRSASVDSITNQTSPQRIIVTEQISPATARTNHADNVTVDFDRPSTNIRGYIQSPWAVSSTSNSTNPNKPDVLPRPPPLSTNRILPVQFNENTKASVPSVPSTAETSNPPRIPPPGMYPFVLI